jgi:hypothetical protein
MANEKIGAPVLVMDVECWEPDGNGGIRKVWRTAGKNVVLDQGKGQLFNRAFGFQTASTFGPYLFLHSATTASNQVWSNVSASQVGSYGNNVPQFSFASTYTNGSATATASYGFTAGTQTVSGAAIAWHTTNTLSTNAATAGIALYNMGQFAASQQVQNGNTISVSGTLSFV